MTMAEFTLFRLDPKAIINVLENFDVYEIVNLSLCSIKSFKFSKIVIIGRERLCHSTKASVRLKDRNMHITLTTCTRRPLQSKDYMITCEDLSESLSYPSRLNSGEAYGAHFLQSITSHRCHLVQNKLAFFWEDKNEGMRIILKHIMMLYDVHIHNLNVGIDYKYLLETLDLINSNLGQGRTIQYITLYAKRFANEKVLKTWDIFDRLSPDTSIDSYVEIRAPIRQLVHSQLMLLSAPWVTSQWLLAFNCRLIGLARTKLTSADINVYLKGWVEGACPNVEFIDFGEVEVNFTMMTEGIPATPLEIKARLFPGSRNSARFTVRRNNGTAVATITVQCPPNKDPTSPGKYKLTMRVKK